MLDAAHWPGDIDAVVLAVHEALMNSYRHAGGVTSASMGLDGPDVCVEIRDAGRGFDVDHHAGHAPDAMAERGRGLWLISQIAQSWDVTRRNGETSLCLRFQP